MFCLRKISDIGKMMLSTDELREQGTICCYDEMASRVLWLQLMTSKALSVRA